MLLATSIDGTLTGLGGNLIIIDDPIKLGDTMSDAVRERVIELYRSTLLSRGDHGHGVDRRCNVASLRTRPYWADRLLVAPLVIA